MNQKSVRSFVRSFLSSHDQALNYRSWTFKSFTFLVVYSYRYVSSYPMSVRLLWTQKKCLLDQSLSNNHPKVLKIAETTFCPHIFIRRQKVF